MKEGNLEYNEISFGGFKVNNDERVCVRGGWEKWGFIVVCLFFFEKWFYFMNEGFIFDIVNGDVVV